MNFKFKSSAKTVLLVMMAIGALCLAAVYFTKGDHGHTRFWSDLLHNSVFFTGIAFMGIFFYAICVTAYAGWNAVFKRVWEAFGLFLIVGIVLMGIITLATVFDWHHLYHWADEASVAEDGILQHKSQFLNNGWYGIFGMGVLLVWLLFTLKLRQLSIKEDSVDRNDFSVFRTMKKYSAALLPIGGFSSAAVIWLWIMSIDAHWYSTMFAWYTGASWFVSMICLTILVLIYLKGQGYYQNVTMEHFHDLGKFLFAFSIFWTYLWFSQFMLIWYANVGEETIYFRERYDNYPVLFYGNLVINFVLPFLVLLRNDTKRKYGTLIFVSIVVLFGHWIDFFLMIKPGVTHTAHELAAHHGGGDHVGHAAEHAATLPGTILPGLLEIGIFLGFLGLFLYFVLNRLTKAPLVGKGDPYLQESLHHHT